MFDLSKLTESELRALNVAVVDRIRTLQRATSAVAAAKFNVGQLVTFKSGKSPFSPIVTAKIVSINVKSVTVTDVATGKGWRVAPAFLSPAPALTRVA